MFIEIKDNHCPGVVAECHFCEKSVKQCAASGFTVFGIEIPLIAAGNVESSEHFNP